MERPVFKPVGTPAEELDTPALVVDAAALDHNIETVHSFFRSRDARLRPHVEAHRTPAIAHKQIAAGGTVGGISVTTVGEAEVFAQSGFTDILIASETVTRQKIARLCGLARQAKVTVAADNPQNVKDLSQAAASAGVTLNVLVDIYTRLERSGVEPGKPAVELAKAITSAPGLHFAGFMSHDGPVLNEDPEKVAKESRRSIQQVLDTREMAEKAGLDVQVVSVGGTHNYETAGAMSGVTEVPAGSYALLDARYRKSRPQLRCAAMIIATVISHPEPGWAFVDCGQKASGVDLELPVAEMEGATITRMSAEHAFVKLEGRAYDALDIGDKLWITPWEIGNAANLYDYIHIVRNGRLEAVWSVAARGRYR